MNTFFYGILDSDSSYSVLFANYLNNLSRFHNNFMVFTDIEALINFQFKKDLRILFISQDFDIDIVSKHISLEHIVVLTEKPHENPDSVPYHILKYDSPESIFYKAESILSEALSSSEHSSPGNPLSFFYNLMNDEVSYIPYDFKFIGIYNPYNILLQTSYALTLSLILSEHKPVLFIDLARFSPIKTGYDCIGNFSDLIFYFRTNKAALNSKLHSVIYPDFGFDYINPPKMAEDISSFPKDVFSSCLHFLANEFGYSYIIVNFGDYLNPLGDYISCCHKMLVPYSDGVSPIQDMYNYLHLSGLSQLITSIVGCDPLNNYILPSDSPDNIIKSIKSSSSYKEISDFATQNIIKGGLSDVRSNKK